jgi:hypothetical protein
MKECANVYLTKDEVEVIHAGLDIIMQNCAIQCEVYKNTDGMYKASFAKKQVKHYRMVRDRIMQVRKSLEVFKDEN